MVEPDNLSNQEIFVLTMDKSITFYSEITCLQKYCLSIVIILWLAFFTNQHIKTY